MKKIWILLVLLSSLLILVGCGGGGGGGGSGDSDDNLANLASMNITDAKSVFIGSGSGSGAANSSAINSLAKASGNNSTSRLYKINNAGVIDEVQFFDKNHNKIILKHYDQEMYPVFIENINEDYIAVGFSDIYQASSNIIWLQLAIIARKSDGAIFKLKNTPDCRNLNNFGGWGLIKNKGLFSADKLGNIYYINQGYEEWDGDKHTVIRAGVTKLSVSGSNLTSTIITPSVIDDCYGCEVDDSGNLFWRGYSQTLGEDVIRITTAGGQTKTVPTYSTIWVDLDGRFHYIENQDVKMINPENIETPEVYGTFGEWPNSWADYKVSLQGYTYLMSSGGILEVYNPGASPRTIDLGFTITSIYGVACTENYYYIAGKDNSSHYFLIKVTPGGTSYTTILGNDYQVYAFSASESDGITFNALSNNDMKKVMGRISIDGSGLRILDYESNNTQVTFLERIR